MGPAIASETASITDDVAEVTKNVVPVLSGHDKAAQDICDTAAISATAISIK